MTTMKISRKNILLHFFLLIIFNSCENEKPESIGPVINISESFQKQEKVDLSRIASDIEYIQLRTDTSNVISSVRSPHKNIRFYNDFILINDVSGHLALYDSSGNFKTDIGTLGRGPHEYMKADSFTWLENEGENQIAIYSAGQKKAQFYDMDGQYVNRLKIEFLNMGMIAYTDELLFINPFGLRKESDY